MEEEAQQRPEVEALLSRLSPKGRRRSYPRARRNFQGRHYRALVLTPLPLPLPRSRQCLMTPSTVHSSSLPYDIALISVLSFPVAINQSLDEQQLARSTITYLHVGKSYKLQRRVYRGHMIPTWYRVGMPHTTTHLHVL